MKIIKCTKCGSNDLYHEEHYVVCSYCRIKFTPSAADRPVPESVISVYDDIQALILRCQNEPHNSRRIAGLILDLDPSNVEAHKYLR